MRILVFFMALVLLFSGCADKQVSEPMVVYKEKYIPIKCNAKMPLKPKNDGTFETDKKIAVYYRDCERKLKKCLGIKEEDGK
ncbi:hypothetical protein [Campylobacter concisus]|jgi:hypothetical protein|uniref:hypothetical protein n=1 Tax=Campylobacter concisus TaxID=199 RepID=UPI000D313D3F|nr:hypothetical protein [Campylobacter concisus]DAT12254.1 MAG TPA: Prokaryotic membrane lipoprotein lipid attachment site [Caudoviricetes sp.]